MSGDISKEERERQLDERIKALRAKNAQMEQRRLEVDKDRQLAEQNKSSITVKTKYPEPADSFVPPSEARSRRGGGDNNNRPRREELAENKHQPPVVPRKVGGGGGRLGETDGPPPDPGYRFLADRMREGDGDSEEEEEEASDSRRRLSDSGGGNWTRGRGGRGGGGGRGLAAGGRGRRIGERDPVSTRYHQNSTGSGSHYDEKGRERRHHHEQEYNELQPLAGGDKLLERGLAGGPRLGLAANSTIEGFAQPRHHGPTPLLSPKDEEGQTRRGAYIAPFRNSGSSGGQPSAMVGQQQRHHETYSAKVKSLLAEDPLPPLPRRRYRVDSADSWVEDDYADEEEEYQRQVLLSSPRKIEAQGGKITITRTLNNSPGRYVDDDNHVAAEASPTRQPPFSPPQTNTGTDAGQRRLQADVNEGYSATGSFDSEAVYKEFIPYSNRSPAKPSAVSSYSNGHISISQQQQAMLMAQQQQQQAAPQPLLTLEEQARLWEEDSAAMAMYDQAAAAGDWLLMPTYGAAMVPMNPQLVSVPSFPPPFYPAAGRPHPGMAAAVGGSAAMPQYFAAQHSHVPVTAAGYPVAGGFHPHQTDYLHYPDPTVATATAAIATSSSAATRTPQTAFNPAAQVFVPPSEQLPSATCGGTTGIYQSPPPPVIASASMSTPSAAYQQRNNFQTVSSSNNINNNNKNVSKPDPNLLVSLKNPPAPLPFNRSQEGRKYYGDSAAAPKFSHSPKPSGGVGRPPSEKYSQNSSSFNNSRLPPRFQKNRDIPTAGGSGDGSGQHQSPQPVKELSMNEMQAASQRHVPFPRPPANHGRGLLVFGTSNIVNYLQTERLSAQLGGMPVRLIPAMKMDVFEEKVEEVSPTRDWIVLVHGLGMAILNFCKYKIFCY
jgi:hypothetical protein